MAKRLDDFGFGTLQTRFEACAKSLFFLMPNLGGMMLQQILCNPND